MGIVSFLIREKNYGPLAYKKRYRKCEERQNAVRYLNDHPLFSIRLLRMATEVVESPKLIAKDFLWKLLDSNADHRWILEKTSKRPYSGLTLFVP
jgi:hypothetical protein